MPAKRPQPKTPAEPVTETEVCQVVKEAILAAFDGRPLDPDVARRGLAHAAHDFIQMKLGEVAESPKRGGG